MAHTPLNSRGYITNFSLPSVILLEVNTSAIPATWGKEATRQHVTSVLQSVGLNVEFLLMKEPAELDRIVEVGAFVFANARQFRGLDGATRLLAEFLDERGIPYLGSGPVGLAAANKHTMKERLKQYEVATPRWVTFAPGTSASLDGLRFPLIVKPVSGAGSVGVSRVNRPDELSSALNAINSIQGGPAIVEEFCRAREYTVALIGSDPPAAFPLQVILPSGYTFLSREAMRSFKSAFIPITETITRNRLIDLARRAFITLEFRDWARIDIVADDNGGLYVIDANTQPSLSHRPERDAPFVQCISTITGASYDDVIACLIGSGLVRAGLGVTPTIRAAMDRILDGNLWEITVSDQSSRLTGQKLLTEESQGEQA
jgi:D-alanine-D-alanine ligase